MRLSPDNSAVLSKGTVHLATSFESSRCLKLGLRPRHHAHRDLEGQTVRKIRRLVCPAIILLRVHGKKWPPGGDRFDRVINDPVVERCEIHPARVFVPTAEPPEFCLFQKSRALQRLEVCASEKKISARVRVDVFQEKILARYPVLGGRV